MSCCCCRAGRWPRSGSVFRSRSPTTISSTGGMHRAPPASRVSHLLNTPTPVPALQAASHAAMLPAISSVIHKAMKRGANSGSDTGAGSKAPAAAAAATANGAAPAAQPAADVADLVGEPLKSTENEFEWKPAHTTVVQGGCHEQAAGIAAPAVAARQPNRARFTMPLCPGRQPSSRPTTHPHFCPLQTSSARPRCCPAVA